MSSEIDRRNADLRERWVMEVSDNAVVGVMVGTMKEVI